MNRSARTVNLAGRDIGCRRARTGLAVVKNLVDLHGGSVIAASDGIGRGTRFTITLPLSP